MKTLLKILLLSSCLYSCQGLNQKDAAKDNDSGNITLPPDSALNNGNESSNSGETGDFEKETTRQVMANLLASKQEINQLRREVSDSLTKSGLSAERRSLFSKTIQELEASSELVNKQIEQILITDLQTNKGKLTDIIKKMRVSESELGGMIAKLDKITGYMQIATNLLQSLIPVPAAKSHTKDSRDK